MSKKTQLTQARNSDLYDPMTGDIKLLDFNDARKALAYVNRGRLRLASRIREMVLWPDPSSNSTWKSKVRPTDPPLVQLAYKLRDEINETLALSTTGVIDPAVARVRGNLFGQLGSVLAAIGKEANQASAELADVLSAHELLEQRKIEHLDRMELLKAAHVGANSDDHLARAAGIERPSVPAYDALPSPVEDELPIVIEDEPPTEPPTEQ